MEPPAGLEEEFNDWYDTEHLPQRRGLPGFESGSRWACVAGWPRWAALYDLATPDALDTPEYRAVSGPNSTPWSRRVLPRTVGRSRVVAEQVLPCGAPARPVAEVGQLALARYRQEVDPVACAQAAAGLTGLLQLRVFHARGGSPREASGEAPGKTSGEAPREAWAAAEFDRPQPPDAVRAALGVVGDVPAAAINLYVPYHRG